VDAVSAWQRLDRRLRLLRENRWFRVSAYAAIVLLFVGFVSYRLSGDWRQLAQARVTMNVGYLFLAWALPGINMLLFLSGWHGIVTALDGSRDWRSNTLVYCYTYLARLLPTPLPFLASRVKASGRLGLHKRQSLHATGLELGLHALTGVVLLAVLELVRYGRWGCAAVVVAGVVVGCVGRLPQRVGLLPATPQNRMAVVSSGLYLGVTWVIAGPFLQAVVRAFLPASLDLWDAWRVWLIAGLASYVGFLLLGGTGLLRDLSLSALLTSFFSPAEALIVAVGARLVLMVSTLSWTVVIAALIRLTSAVGAENKREVERDD